MSEANRRRRRQLQYDVGVSESDAHALEVSTLMRELQAHLERVRRGEASTQELAAVSKMVIAAHRARRGER